ncbi:MAG: pimeloyl-[acyl-carrier protein] methyl ester esterase [Glaciecola sp.]|jgi:pimeloyl-[acyl-carrier protein] methyl ester esterase
MHIVLLPGMDGTGELFGPLVEALPEGVKVTIVRYPRAEVLGWDGLLELVEAAVPIGEPYCVVAESFSGPIAMRFAAAKPLGLQSLVLCASFCRNPLAKGLGWIARFARPAIFKRRPPGAFVRRYLVDASSPETLVDSVQQAIAQVNPGVMANRVKLVNESNTAAELGKVKVPVLYLEGSRDRIVGGRGWMQVHAAHPSTEHGLLDGPHLLLQCVPKHASAAILSFLERHR